MVKSSAMINSLGSLAICANCFSSTSGVTPRVTTLATFLRASASFRVYRFLIFGTPSVMRMAVFGTSSRSPSLPKTSVLAVCKPPAMFVDLLSYLILSILTRTLFKSSPFARLNSTRVLEENTTAPMWTWNSGFHVSQNGKNPNDAMAWKRFPHYWPFVRENNDHRGIPHTKG